MIKKNDLLKNFNEEERKIASKIYDKYILTVKTSKESFSDFVSPNILFKIKESLGEDSDIEFGFNGGSKKNERTIISFRPYNSYAEVIYPISILKIKYNNKFNKKILHKDILGSLIGLGIDRKKIGDILVRKDIYIFVSNSIKTYVLMNLEQIGKVKVICEEAQESDINIEDETLELKIVLLSSKRIDLVISKVFNFSRNKASELIIKGKVQVNWNVIINKKLEIKEDDMISIRGYGRRKIDDLTGISKKNKIILKYFVF